ncbi:SDR family oxidoreductase [Romeria aff. gracilis LEGE 07310]|uniref:SDR family oxidoreductase n=1 Tax=Vasconcelosia minhoensis LEGE 07310 TaxID=915328 RepID=A0A8J7A802_9CYAN|nr:SDR family oxidoreductase [Romeria gracilis]MBE9078752.1 SDR family oxidoreductase [Romeria aff. gracilis LEGE 07310]
MKAFVAGATGRTGQLIVEQLIARDIPVRAMVRDLAKGRDQLPTSIELVEGDVMKPETLGAAMATCTVVLCATGATPSLDPTGPYQVDYEGNKNLINAAKQAGAEQFVIVSSLCVSKFFHPLNLFWLVLYWKKQAEDYLKASGLPYTIVRPGGLRSEDSSDPVVMAPADTLFEGSIPRQQVAQVCVEALTEPAAKNKVVEIVARENATPQPIDAQFATIQ